MLERLQEYLIPTSVAEAVRMLRDSRGGKAVAITGAIDVHWMRLQSASRFVDTSRLGLDQIKDLKTALEIGAATSLEDIVQSRPCARLAGGLLRQGALSMVSLPRRCETTLAALLINAVPWCDLVPALLALDAKVTVQGNNKRTVALADFFAGKGRADVDRELLLEVAVPKPKGKFGAALERTAYVPSDNPILSCAATVTLERGKIKTATVAMGGGLPIAVRLPEVEQALREQRPSEDLFREAGAQAAAAIEPIDDVRASADHRRAVCPAIVRRALSRAAGLEERA